MSEDERSQAPDHLKVLAKGEIEVIGRLPWSSNRTFMTRCVSGDLELLAVYKPGRGERKLWDFPPCIYRREVAAFELSEILGWEIVPQTVEREDAPYGPGSLQRFVTADFSEHHFTLVEDETNHDGLRTICAFDVVANNADRKSGHCLIDEDGHIWAIDNGLSFHRQPKLRTVIWEFAGEAVPERVLVDLQRVLDDTKALDGMRYLLTGGEIEALRQRIRGLLRARRFPVPDPDTYHYPWPLV